VDLFESDGMEKLMHSLKHQTDVVNSPQDNPYVNREMLPPHSDMLFGREKELKTIRELLSKPKSVSIIGERRIGKSSLANRLYHNFSKSIWESTKPTEHLVLSTLAQLLTHKRLEDIGPEPIYQKISEISKKLPRQAYIKALDRLVSMDVLFDRMVILLIKRIILPEGEALYNSTILMFFLKWFIENNEIPENLTDLNLRTDLSDYQLDRIDKNFFHFILGRLYYFNKQKSLGDKYFEMAINNAPNADKARLSSAKMLLQHNPFDKKASELLLEIAQSSDHFRNAAELLRKARKITCSFFLIVQKNKVV
jgi:hypothetical protein